MFLAPLVRRNPRLIVAAVTLHQEGRLPANSYVLDLDAIETNTTTLSSAAHAAGLTVWAMTKQVGRARPAIEAMRRGGVDGFVAVDMACARPIKKAKQRVGHLGHLVQVPRSATVEAATMQPEFWTVFSQEKAEEATRAAGQIGADQRLLVRVDGPGDVFYPGHEGGFPASEILEVASDIARLDHGRFAGITTFPALLYDREKEAVVATPNLATLERAAEALRAAGSKNVEINAPGTTSVDVLPILTNAGATQIEPGHGLTGTTPLHAVRDLAELPASLYLTEVSHLHGGRAYCFGGGLYIDPVFDDYPVTALVGGSAEEALANPPVPAHIPSPASIDYYGQLDLPTHRRIRTGDTVVFGFRMQAFFTRALIAPIAGLATGRPVVEGLWRGDGSKSESAGALA